MNEFFRRKKRQICIFFPVFLGLLYMVLCFIHINSSIGADEATLDHFSKFSPAEIWRGDYGYNQPPLYVYVLKIWASLCGHNLLGMRLLSVLFGITTILFVFKWVNYKYKTQAACLSTALLAISPFFVCCGQEIGSFTMLAAIFAASNFFLQLYIDNNEKKWLVSYFILALLGIYTHNLFLFVWLAQASYLFICKHKKALLGYLAIALCYLPWIPKLVSHAHYAHQIADGFNLGKIASFWTESSVLSGPSEIKNFCALLVLANLIVFAFLCFKRRNKQLLLPLCFGFLLVIPSIMSALKLTFFPYTRCLICAAIIIPILAGIILVRSKRINNLIKASCILVIVANILFGFFNLYSKHDCSVVNCSDADRVLANIGAFGESNKAIMPLGSDLYYEFKYYEDDKLRIIAPSEVSIEDEYYWIVTTSDEIAFNEDLYELADNGVLNYHKSYYFYRLHRK